MSDTATLSTSPILSETDTAAVTPPLAGAAGVVALAFGSAAVISLLCAAKPLLSDWMYWGLTLMALGLVNAITRDLERVLAARFAPQPEPVAVPVRETVDVPRAATV